MAQETSGFMERQLLERMIGAGVLLVALVIIVPAILDGRPDVEETPPLNSADQDVSGLAAPSRTHTIHLDRRPESPPVARQAVVPEPQPRAAQPDSNPPAPTLARPATTAKSVTRPKPQPAPPAAQAAPPKPTVVARTAVPKPVSKAAAASARAGWVVQLGAFSQAANAQRRAENTRAKGFPAFVIPLQRSGKTLYRVRVGPRDSREAAEKLAASLAKAGFTGQVVEQKPGD